MFFASDNSGPVHPEVLTALSEANQGYQPSYGDDTLMDTVRSRLRELFEAPDARVFLTATGTASVIADSGHTMSSAPSAAARSVPRRYAAMLSVRSSPPFRVASRFRELPTLAWTMPTLRCSGAFSSSVRTSSYRHQPKP